MMVKKKQLVQMCGDCHHFAIVRKFIFGKKKHFCGLLKRFMETPFPIPDWCLLSDWEKQEEPE